MWWMSVYAFIFTHASVQNQCFQAWRPSNAFVHMIRYAWLDIQVKKRKKNGSVVETFIKNQPLVSRVLEQPQLKFTS